MDLDLSALCDGNEDAQVCGAIATEQLADRRRLTPAVGDQLLRADCVLQGVVAEPCSGAYRTIPVRLQEATGASDAGDGFAVVHVVTVVGKRVCDCRISVLSLAHVEPLWLDAVQQL